MPVTRSASRVSTTPAAPEPKTPRLPKRKSSTAASAASKKKKAEPSIPTPSVPEGVQEDAPTPLPAQLTFSFEDAKQHLINADSRFEDIFRRLPCKPFERVDAVEPFRTLTTAILGQQISWLAARSITHKFLRLFFPELPEKPDEHYWSKSAEAPFPTPHQVAQIDLAVLRTAGLSGRKAEYVRDLAARFADGRLSTKKLFEANDEELYAMLTAVYGIGKWTVDMFAIFSLRRPDILPAGDLGVQRGVLRWFLSLHHPTYRVDISPQKLPKDPAAEPDTPVPATPASKAKAKSKAKANAEPESQKTEALDSDDSDDDDDDVLPVFGEPKKPSKKERTLELSLADISQSSATETPSQCTGNALAFAREGPGPLGATPSVLGLPSMPPPLTPSINAALQGKQEAEKRPLPDGMSVTALKSRLDGKKKIKGAILTPKEMEELTDHWRPYRSLGVYYMWALAEEK
ncbi:DNA glycosylase [Artomyces pyxidatus]|uniref:DNA glycosylase n=1 Tax=Artomyces pyxidatus TaxID=48021 RepID=A0ACB8TB07_9AGAM|nr:DNA glycosylase [Artomyces pyxidatus]